MAIPKQEMASQEKLQRFVLAGMKFMYAKETFPMLMQGIAEQAPMPQKLAMETAGIVKMVDDRSASGIPPDVLPQMSMLIMMELVDFMRQSETANPTQEDFNAAMPILQTILKEVFTKNGKAVRMRTPLEKRAGGGAPMPQGQPAPQQAAPQAAPPQPGGLIAGAQQGA